MRRIAEVCVVFVLLFITVVAGVVALGYLMPMARRDADSFGGASAAIVATFSATGCAAVGWLLLTRRVTEAGVDHFFSFLFVGAAIWVFGFLVPKAARERDPFGILCAIVAGLLALAAWLLIGVGVRSV